MKFLIDENIPDSLIVFLKKQDHQAIDVKRSKYSRTDDIQLINIATKNNYIILTFDKDFLTFKKEGFNLKCIIFNIKSLDIAYLQSYLTMILSKHKSVFKRKRFILFCKKDAIILSK